MIGDGDVLKGDLLGVLEERIRPPHGVEPRRGQQAVLGRQVVGETKSVVLPRLREENVGRVRLCLDNRETEMRPRRKPHQRRRFLISPFPLSNYDTLPRT